MAVTSGKHADSTGNNVHVPFAFEYADATARAAATGFVPADVGKLARQLDNNTLWMLTDDSPVTWIGLGSATAIHTDIANEISGLTEKTTLADDDLFVIEDSAASYVKKKVKKSNVGGGGSGTAIYPQDTSVFALQFKIAAGITSGWSISQDAAQIYCFQQFQAGTPANGDAAQCTVMLKAGTYDVYFLGIHANNRAKIDWSMDGVDFVTGQDWYNGSTQNNIVKTGTITIASDGRHLLKWTANGKNVSSSNYYVVLTAVWFTSQSQAAET